MTLLQTIKNQIRRRSIHVSYVDTASCNGCDIEVLACLAPKYDLEQYGIYVHNNPREADVLLVIGGVTEQWIEKLPMLWDKIPEPKVAIAIGNCAISGCVFSRPGGYTKPPVSKYIPVALSIPGCPPRPDEIIQAILAAAPIAFHNYEQNQKRQE